MPNTEEPIEDFLEVDRPIHGQNYVCLSFISPETFLKQREFYFFNQFMNHFISKFDERIDEVTKKASDDLKNRVNKNLKKELRNYLNYSYDQFKERFEEFKLTESDRVSKEFDEFNEFRTSIRGLKVRGIFDTYKEAQIRAKVLQRTDQSHNVFIGQVGYWLPWDPEADKVQDQEYLNDELNKLMSEYKKNETKRDLFYEEQKREKKQHDRKKNVENKTIDSAIESLSIETSNNAVNNTADSLSQDDPWIQRKNQENDSEPSNTEEQNNEESNDINNDVVTKIL